MTGILIIARLGSTRLAQKHLIEAAGIPFIGWLSRRFATAFGPELEQGRAALVIATTDEPANEAFSSLELPHVQVFYGDRNNIPLRQLQCARALGLDRIISVDGDDVLCSTEAARKVYDRLQHGSSLVKSQGLPLGMNVWGYTTATLEASLQGQEAVRSLETGWGRIFPDEAEVLELEAEPGAERLRMTLDYEADAHFFRSVIESYGPQIVQAGDREMIRHILEGGFERINSDLDETYWANFNRQQQHESM